MNYEIILATNNKHKLKEVREILSPHKIVVYGLSDLMAKPEEVNENGKTYAENALIKAKAVGSHAVYPLASNVARRPPEGKEEASDSPRTSSLPENSSMILPLSSGSFEVAMKLSCFSAVTPVIGWNQCV